MAMGQYNRVTFSASFDTLLGSVMGHAVSLWHLFPKLAVRYSLLELGTLADSTAFDIHNKFDKQIYIAVLEDLAASRPPTYAGGYAMPSVNLQDH